MTPNAALQPAPGGRGSGKIGQTGAKPRQPARGRGLPAFGRMGFAVEKKADG